MKKIWQGIILPIMLYFISAIIATLLCSFIVERNRDVYVIFISSIFIILILYLYSKCKKLVIERCFYKEKKLDLRRVIYIIPIGFSFALLYNLLITVTKLDEIFPNGYNVTNELLNVSPILTILIGAILTPIAEEIVFRGYVYKSVKFGFGKNIAIIISSILFALVHGNVVQGIYAFLAGILFSYIYDEFENIIATILVHCVANATVFVIAIMGYDFHDDIFMHNVLFIIVCIVILLMSLYRLFTLKCNDSYN